MNKLVSALVALGSAATLSPGAHAVSNITFPMVVSAGAAGCLPNAAANVTVSSIGEVENMHVVATGLPANLHFDLFVLQVPKSPFGLSWYQGDLVTDDNGAGVVDVTGRFSRETFFVAPGVAPAPSIFHGPFPDATSNPATNPIQTYHLGLWFDSPTAAAGAGCPGTTTPFNGNHQAGIQVMNTSNFPDLKGPLLQLR
jgi:hypothetical protein